MKNNHKCVFSQPVSPIYSLWHFILTWCMSCICKLCFCVSFYRGKLYLWIRTVFLGSNYDTTDSYVETATDREVHTTTDVQSRNWLDL